MTKENLTNFLRWFFKTVLIFIGFIIIIMPFYPSFLEYFFNAPEKVFSLKEITIICLGVLLFSGGLFSNTIIAAIQNFIKNKLH